MRQHIIPIAIVVALAAIVVLGHRTDRQIGDRLSATVARLDVTVQRLKASDQQQRRQVAALCTLRGGLTDDIQTIRDRIKASKAYLTLHPSGAPALGITVQDIQRSIRGDENLLRLRVQKVGALSVLACPKPKEAKR